MHAWHAAHPRLSLTLPHRGRGIDSTKTLRRMHVVQNSDKGASPSTELRRITALSNRPPVSCPILAQLANLPLRYLGNHLFVIWRSSTSFYTQDTERGRPCPFLKAENVINSQRQCSRLNNNAVVSTDNELVSYRESGQCLEDGGTYIYAGIGIADSEVDLSNSHNNSKASVSIHPSIQPASQSID